MTLWSITYFNWHRAFQNEWLSMMYLALKPWHGCKCCYALRFCKFDHLEVCMKPRTYSRNVTPQHRSSFHHTLAAFLSFETLYTKQHEKYVKLSYRLYKSCSDQTATEIEKNKSVNHLLYGLAIWNINREPNIDKIYFLGTARCFSHQQSTQCCELEKFPALYFFAQYEGLVLIFWVHVWIFFNIADRTRDLQAKRNSWMICSYCWPYKSAGKWISTAHQSRIENCNRKVKNSTPWLLTLSLTGGAGQSEYLMLYFQT